MGIEVDRIKDVERAMRCRHRKAGRHQGDNLGLAKNLAYWLSIVRVGNRRRFRQDERVKQNARQDSPADPKHTHRRRHVEQRTGAHDGNDEANRAPEPNAAVASALFAQVVEGQGLDQRQCGTPEKGEHCHRQQHAGQLVEPEKCGEASQSDNASQTNDRHAPTEMVSQPAP